MKDLEISMVDVTHFGWTMYICVSIVLCIFCVLFQHLFYFIALRSFFYNRWLQLGSKGIDATPKIFRKTRPWSNKIKQMWKQNKKDTQYNKDTDLSGSPSVGYVH